MKHRIWWIIAAGVLLMGLGMMGAGAVLKDGSPTVPQGCDLISVTAGTNASQSSAALTLQNISDMQTNLKGAMLSWWAEGTGAVSTTGTVSGNAQADVYAVAAAFQDLHPVRMVYGTFLPRVENGSHAVVLDSSLAYSLFGTENAVGMDIQFSGITYQVCGVYRADSSLLGLLTGGSLPRAYITGYDLISSGKLTIGGYEAILPHAAPGVSLQSVQSAMQTEGVPTSAFYMTDKTQQVALDTEVSLAAQALLAISAMLVLLLFFLRVARGIFREALAILNSSYLSQVWGSLLWRLVKIVLILTGFAAMCWLLWSCVGLNFNLPAKYIPGSWIDTTFYTTLIKTESQAAIAARNYPLLWWDAAYNGAVGLSHGLDLIAMLGMVLTALGLRALWADRKTAGADPRASQSLKDIPALWGWAVLSVVAFLLMNYWTGLPLRTAWGALGVLALSLSVWACAMHKTRFESFFYKTY